MLDGANALAIITDWNQFRDPDFCKIKEMLRIPIVFDGRNLYQSQRMDEAEFTFYSIGRQPVE